MVTHDVFLCIYKFFVYMFAPLCVLVTSIYDFDFDKVSFYAIVATLQIQLVHMVRYLAGLLKRFDLYYSAQKKVDTIVNEDTRNKAPIVYDYNTIEIIGADYTYIHDVTRSTVRIQIPHLTIHKGDKLCIYGESGQGKTTTLNILSRQIDTDNVYIDGVKTDGMIDCVFISQDTEIFDMSVRDNLTLGNESITDDELIECLDGVGLLQWLESQPLGLDTLLGERGVFVSTGQRQRLNLVRGLLIQDRDLYLLDEPTSNVDEYTEEKDG